jgi:adenosylcobinamide kinase / adenosylcobinamide-phosphate guanylyltransferase
VSLTFLIGGARSGKSTLALRLGTELGRAVTLIATAEPRDDDMAARIARHRAERPPAWTTLEVPLALGDALASIDDRAVAIVDCLTLWVSNALEDGREDDAIVDEARTVAAALAEREAPAVVVSNEVGLGIVPVNELARRYRDVLGRVNAAVADRAGRSLLVVAGRALELARVELT